jgi:hypothetical protein
VRFDEFDFQFHRGRPHPDRAPRRAAGPSMSAAASPRTDPAASACRCVCGSLVARVVADGIELKCRRCKRKLLVPLSRDTSKRPGAPLRVRVVSDSA